MMVVASQQETPSTSAEGIISDAMNARGRLLTTHRRNKVASSSRSACGERNYGDSGYKVMARHEDHADVENGTNKDLHVLKQQLKE